MLGDLNDVVLPSYEEVFPFSVGYDILVYVLQEGFVFTFMELV